MEDFEALHAAISEAISEITDRANEGTLTADDADALVSGACLNEFTGHGEASTAKKPLLLLLLQNAYSQRASFPIFTTEYLDALAAFLHAAGLLRILEVAGGRGLLAAPMHARGIHWRVTELAPPDVDLSSSSFSSSRNNSNHVEACDALHAVRRDPDSFDCCFFSWWQAEAVDEDCAHSSAVPRTQRRKFSLVRRSAKRGAK